MSQALASIEGARKLRLLILDACRDNPFASTIVHTQGATRSIGRGLGRVEPDAGTLVAYAARDGQVAQDGDGHNSPFVTSLVHNIGTPGLEISRLFRRVTGDVMKATDRRQEPFTYGSLPDEEFYFKPPMTPAVLSEPQPEKPAPPATSVSLPSPTVLSPSPALSSAGPVAKPRAKQDEARRRVRPSAVASIGPSPVEVPIAVRRAKAPPKRSTQSRSEKANVKVARRAKLPPLPGPGWKRSGQPGNPFYKPVCANGTCQLND